ncbi:unnamed protein product [Prorocentrum cordatum]|uniref:Globin domain-containing protein n=1 Tax=Prorocentrum cordatum TaxID=2364126 RepID=A0ABN9V295_9DINO|nr:unnamed protein product [Polarella glacialis]
MVDAPGSRAEAANEGLAGSRPESRKGDQGEEEEEEEEAGENATYNSREVNDQVFEELHLGLASGDVQGSWRDFLGSAESREAAGEAIYAAVFDAAPSLQSLFKTPRAVMAMRFMNGLNQIISSLHDPKALKVVVETLGFQHLDLEVTIPRVIMFRDAIVELLQIELGARMSSRAREGWNTMLNYVGGSYIYVRLRFADRLKILAGSWATANQRQQDELAEEANDGDEKEGEGSHDTDATDPERDDKHGAGQNLLGDHGASGASKSKRRVSMWGFGGKRSTSSSKAGQEASKSMDESGTSKRNFRNASVPTTYNEMFYFNAAVMGFGQSRWMNEVLASFDTIVTNVANSYRLQEECDVLSLRIAKYKGAISLGEYKAVMLASLRSLVPKDWDSNHEVAWSWLWENVERMLKAQMGKPAAQERALEALWGSQDEASQAYLRREVYVKFFTLAPAGQDYFKQSTTRLHFIADRIVSMTLEIYRDPQKMVEDISALGLRHVGYGIPTDSSGPSSRPACRWCAPSQSTTWPRRPSGGRSASSRASLPA